MRANGFQVTLNSNALHEQIRSLKLNMSKFRGIVHLPAVKPLPRSERWEANDELFNCWQTSPDVHMCVDKQASQAAKETPMQTHGTEQANLLSDG